MKTVTLVSDDKITGTKYGTIEIPDTIIRTWPPYAYTNSPKITELYMARIRKNNQKHK